MAEDELRVGFSQLRPGASRDTLSWKATVMCAVGFGVTAVSWHVTGDAGDIGAVHPFGTR